MRKLSDTLIFFVIADCFNKLDMFLCNNADFFDDVTVLASCYLPYTSLFVAMYLAISFLLNIRIHFRCTELDISHLVQYFDKYRYDCATNSVYSGNLLCAQYIGNSIAVGHMSLYIKILILRLIDTDVIPPKLGLCCTMLLISGIYALYSDILLNAFHKLHINSYWPQHLFCVSLAIIIYRKYTTNSFSSKLDAMCIAAYVALIGNIYDFWFIVLFAYAWLKLEDKVLMHISNIKIRTQNMK